MSSVEECVVAIESQLPLHDSVDTTSNTVTVSLPVHVYYCLYSHVMLHSL